MHLPEGEGRLGHDPVADHCTEHHSSTAAVAADTAGRHCRRGHCSHIVLQDQEMSMKRPGPQNLQDRAIFLKIPDGLPI